MPPEAQALVGQTLHRAIWNWIDNFPGEFIDTVTGQRKLEIAERFFDLLMTYSDDNVRRSTWPALNALLFINYDRLSQAEKNLDAYGIQPLKLSSKGQKKVRISITCIQCATNSHSIRTFNFLSSCGRTSILSRRCPILSCSASLTYYALHPIFRLINEKFRYTTLLLKGSLISRWVSSNMIREDSNSSCLYRIGS